MLSISIKAGLLPLYLLVFSSDIFSTASDLLILSASNHLRDREGLSNLLVLVLLLPGLGLLFILVLLRFLLLVRLLLLLRFLLLFLLLLSIDIPG